MYDKERARSKARELVAKMTVEERASQLTYEAPAIKRLNIPSYNWWNESLHGVARAGVATVFSQAIGMGATFDEALIQKVGEVIAVEGRAKYNEYQKHGDHGIYKGLTYWSPNVNIFRDPRWGRGQETYGEDPYLTSRLGVAYVKGLQGDGDVMKAAACAKHYAVHSGPEAVRHEFNAVVTKKELWETYLPAFEALVKEAEVAGVMGAYNRTNGEPCCASRLLMGDILRGKWQFDGYYVSDCWAIRDFHEHHGVTNTAKESAALALREGCDLNCGNTYLYIMKAYQDGMITEEEITTAAERLFTVRYMLGLFDESEYDSIGYDKVEAKEHLYIADQVTAESLVLLKNDGILPLNHNEIHTIGVVGPNADSREALIGNYHGTSSEYITVLEGIRKIAGDTIRVYYSEGCHLYKEYVEGIGTAEDRIAEALAVAEQSDVVIVCVGLTEALEGEEGDTSNEYASGDKLNLMLPESQRKLLGAIARTGKPTIVCVLAGSALDLSKSQEQANAIIQAWYPGARGGNVIAKAIFGEVVPSGKLPVTFYHGVEELPDFEDYSMTGRTYRYIKKEPLYPFGYGLTYGSLSLCQLTCNKNQEEVQVNVEVENKEHITIDEVLQVYVKNTESIWAVPNWSLCGFKRIRIQAGEKKTIEVILNRSAFEVVNEEGERILDGGHYIIYAGFGQPDERTYALTNQKVLSEELWY